jgi:tetratricopeptide (TPR) repeat protein
LADFIGRSHLTLTISSVMNAGNRSALPVVVLVGMAGVGKSALALHVAHTIRDSYPDGQLYANLRAYDGGPVRPDGVLTGFLIALGFRPDDVPATMEARTALLRTALDRRRVLLVLDDALDAEQVRPLLPGSAGCGVLITSRSRLGGLPTALQADTQAFSPSEALELLARTIGTERVENERTAALEIIASCAMLPLAIRIVAARLAARPNWSLQSLSTRLADERKRIEELKAGNMAISAVFDLSYQQLTERQASALRRTATIDSPSLSLSCAAALLGIDEGEAEELLEELVDQAMLESPSVGRYQFHSLLRDFARRKACQAEQFDAMARLLDFLLATAKNAFTQVVVGDPIEEALSPARATGARFGSPGEARAWAAADGECALTLVGQLARAMLTASSQQKLDCDPRTQLRPCIDLLISLSAFRADLDFALYPDVIELLANAAAHSDDGLAMGRVHFLRGNVELAMSRLGLAEREATVAVRLCRRTQDLVILRQALNDLGLAKQLQGDFQDAIEYYNEAIDLARRLGHTTGEVATTVNTALLKVHMGEPREAERICRQVLAELGSRADDAGIAYTYYVLGLANHTLGEHESAVNWLETCLSLCVASGLRAREGQTRHRLAESLRALKLLDRAAAEARQAIGLCEEVADLRTLGRAFAVLGHTLQDLGDEPGARESLERADEVFARVGLVPKTAQSGRLAVLPGGEVARAQP